MITDLNGTEKFGYSGKASFSAALPYYKYDGSADPLVWITTEVRGLLKA